LRRITKAALGGLAGCALVLAASQAANGDSANMTYLLERAPTGDYQKDAGPFDQAKGTLRVSQSPDDIASGFKLTVEDINGAAGQEFGAHLHTGPCVDGDYAIPALPATEGQPSTPAKVAGWQAGPHYNHEKATTGNPTPAVNTQTEVWFNLVPNAHGDATDDTKVNFVPTDNSLDPLLLPGEMSIVIHVLPTNTEFGVPTAGKPAGDAGARQACFKLLTPNWAP
jgi:Cu/Zn superoxide dismutase